MKNILHISHSWGGGIGHYIDDLISSLNKNVNNYVLSSTGSELTVEFNREVIKRYALKDKYIGRGCNYSTEINNIYSLILQELRIDIIHIHSMLFHTFDFLDIAIQDLLPIVVTVHDFYFICPTFHLVDRDGRFCGTCATGKENSVCIEGHPYLSGEKFDGKDLYDMRFNFKKYIDKISCFIFPSYSTAKILKDFYQIPNSKCKVLYHPSLLKNVSNSPRRVSQSKVMRVGLLGSALMHKGSKEIYELIIELKSNDSIKFFHYGKGFLFDISEVPPSNLYERGSYSRSNIQSLLREDQIDLVLLVSTWPETFCYTLSEAVLSGIPVAVSNQGALAERAKLLNVGYVLDDASVDGIKSFLLNLLSNKTELNQYAENCRLYRPLGSVGFRRQFKSIYKF